jgi:outer membrane protein assembly factor BamB
MPTVLQRIHRAPAGCGLACVVLLLAALALTGCGSSGESEKSSPATKASGYVAWPQFGRVPERTHYLPSNKRVLDPPLKEAWSIDTHGLIEFPPALANGVAYVINKYGNGKAIRLSDRKVLWELKLDPRNHGKPTDVTAPVYHQGRVFGAFLDGYIVAGDAQAGTGLWVNKLNGHLESSPLAVGNRLYVGTDTTDVIALRATNGEVLWSFNSPAAIKASPSFHHGHLFVADYQSSMFALNAADGKLIWRTNTSMVPPFGEGGFFSSPAVAFGRVYAARDDGTVYAFDERTGKVDWAFQTGGAVYGSPAVARVPGTPPTVYIGSENGRLYAIDARTGKPRWTYDIGGAIPGTAPVIGHTVYTSSFETQETTGIDVLTHKRTFHLKQAGYTPVVSDGKQLYLIGYFDLIALQPTKR